MTEPSYGGTRGLWWTCFGLLSIVTVLWSVAMPLFSSPDEQAHQIRAASLARGELLGRRLEGGELPLTRVLSPRSLQLGFITCFAYRPEQTADCQTPSTRDEGDAQANTYVGHYPPTYSLPVGLVGRAAGGAYEPGLQRLGGALLCSALLASAVLSLRSWRGGPAALAFVLALTPMTLFLSGTVNPNGFETAAALLLWASALPLLARPSEASKRLVVRTAVAAGALVLTRPLSPVWLAVIAVLVLLATPWPALRASLLDRRLQVGAAAVVGSGLAAVAWILGADALRVIEASDPERPTTLADAVEGSLSYKIEQLPALVGNFGWVDNPVAAASGWFWLGAVTLLALLAVAAGKIRRTLAIALCLALMFVVPVGLEASQAGEIGYVWQGRYSLPLFVGIPLLAAWALEHRAPTVGRRRLEVLLVLLTLAAHWWALVGALARYTVGEGRGLGLLDPVWDPPLPPLLLVSLYAVALAALGVVLLRSVGLVSRPTGSELVDSGDPEHRDTVVV
jgi:hypothetical protein